MKNVLELLEGAAANWPDRPGLSDEELRFTWGRCLELVRAAGSGLTAFGPRAPVAIWMERSAELPLAMLSVLASGNFYSVLDPAQPQARARAMLERLDPAAVIVDGACRGRAAGLDRPLVQWEVLRRSETQPARLDARRRASIDTDLAYVLFTSGSTGSPKGVAVSHRAVLAYTAWAATAFGFGPETVFGNQSPFCFSMSVTDLYCAMRTGGRVEILPRQLFSFPGELLEYLHRRRVDTLYWTPSALGTVARWQALDGQSLPFLRRVLFAGEPMPVPCLNYWRSRLPWVLFANLYGPTETTDICTYYPVDRSFEPGESLPIGRACDNCGVMLLDELGRRTEPGEVGELCVRGSFLAEGYYNDPAATARAFVEDPLERRWPERIYRTGDLARQDADGLLYCLGRRDGQLKHLGYRIEPGEVEAAAFAQPGVERCACVQDREQDELLLAWQGTREAERALVKRLREHLPGYMLPARLIWMERLPQSPNGKLDRERILALCRKGA